MKVKIAYTVDMDHVPAKSAELLESARESLEKSIKMVTNMISSVKKNLFLKNRNSCTFCEYYNTEHCT